MQICAVHVKLIFNVLLLNVPMYKGTARGIAELPVKEVSVLRRKSFHVFFTRFFYINA